MKPTDSIQTQFHIKFVQDVTVIVILMLANSILTIKWEKSIEQYDSTV